MIDIHSHVLFNVDDGPSKVEDSIRMLSEAEKIGIKEIVSVVHYHEGIFNLDKVDKNFQKLVRSAENFHITLRLGYEVYIDSIVHENINKIINLTLDKTKYILIETPFNKFSDEHYKLIGLLNQNGLTPILAHPERSRFFVENPLVLFDLIENRCLVQMDAASVIGIYGRHVKSLSKELIKKQKAHFVASNAHLYQDYKDRYNKAYMNVKKWSSLGYAEDVFNNNSQLVLENSASLLVKPISCI